MVGRVVGERGAGTGVGAVAGAVVGGRVLEQRETPTRRNGQLAGGYCAGDEVYWSGEGMQRGTKGVVVGPASSECEDTHLDIEWPFGSILRNQGFTLAIEVSRAAPAQPDTPPASTEPPSAADEGPLATIVAMGFDHDVAVQALDLAGGALEGALELLTTEGFAAGGAGREAGAGSSSGSARRGRGRGCGRGGGCGGGRGRQSATEGQAICGQEAETAQARADPRKASSTGSLTRSLSHLEDGLTRSLSHLEDRVSDLTGRRSSKAARSHAAGPVAAMINDAGDVNRLIANAAGALSSPWRAGGLVDCAGRLELWLYVALRLILAGHVVALSVFLTLPARAGDDAGLCYSTWSLWYPFVWSSSLLALMVLELAVLACRPARGYRETGPMALIRRIYQIVYIVVCIFGTLVVCIFGFMAFFYDTLPVRSRPPPARLPSPPASLLRVGTLRDSLLLTGAPCDRFSTLHRTANGEATSRKMITTTASRTSRAPASRASATAELIASFSRIGAPAMRRCRAAGMCISATTEQSFTSMLSSCSRTSRVNEP